MSETGVINLSNRYQGLLSNFILNGDPKIQILQMNTIMPWQMQVQSLYHLRADSMFAANGRRRYCVTTSLIDWLQA